MKFGLIVRDAAIAVALSAAVALSFNALRPAGIELIASRDYDVFVPCPEPMGEVERLDASGIRWGEKTELVIDARSAQEHEQWHPAGMRHIPFDFLTPVCDVVLHEIVESRARRIVVIGDGLVPDTGEQLARELSGQGIKNVHFVEGGMDAVRAQLDGVQGERP